jgi:hypothetical protein
MNGKAGRSPLFPQFPPPRYLAAPAAAWMPAA